MAMRIRSCLTSRKSAEIDALKKAGGTAELVTIPGGRHGNFERDQVLRAWTAIEAFLAKNVISKAVTTSAAR